MKIKAYSYIRMSTDKQALGDSERRQVELSEQYCNNNNLELITDYREQACQSALKSIHLTASNNVQQLNKVIPFSAPFYAA